MNEDFNVSLNGWDTVSTFNQPKPGGYVMQIAKVRLGLSTNNNKTLYVAVDFPDGEFKDYFKNLAVKWNADFWAGSAVITVTLWDAKKECMHWALKRFLQDVQQSNPDFKFDPTLQSFDIRELRGKKIGAIICYKEGALKPHSNTERYINPKVYSLTSVQKIEDGNFTVPGIIRHEENSASNDYFSGTPVSKGYEPFDPDDMPFN